MDLNGIEGVTVNAVGGADTVTVNDLTGTGVSNVNLNLAGTPGGTTGDGTQDHVIVNGTANADTDQRQPSNQRAATVVSGLAALVKVTGIDAGIDQFDLNGQAGNDTIDASKLKANLVNLTINGGDGDDAIIGSDGSDLVNGGRGNDTAIMGAGNDTFVWNPGDGSDIVEGQAGHDEMVFNGANINENINISANGSRPVHPRRGQHHDGHQRRGGSPSTRHGWCRHGHRQRPGRHRRDGRSDQPRQHARRHHGRRSRPTP